MVVDIYQLNSFYLETHHQWTQAMKAKRDIFVNNAQHLGRKPNSCHTPHWFLRPVWV